MTPPPTDEFENLNELRSLREAACDFQHPTLFGPNDCRFYAAAHVALGPEGCITLELERLRAENASLKYMETAESESADHWFAECLALKDEVERLGREVDVLRKTSCEYDYYCRKGSLCRIHEARTGLEAERDTYKNCHKVAMEDNVIRAAEYAELRSERDELRDAVKRLQVNYQNLVDQEVGQAMDCAAHERELLDEIKRLREEVERQRWVFAELDSLKNELAKLKP